MQNLIRVGVADAAHQPGVTQSALHRVILQEQRAGERIHIRDEHFESARIVGSERTFTTEHVEGRAFFWARLC